MNFKEANIQFGDRRLVGQDRVRNQIEQILSSGRIGHAYLLSGPAGSGKTAFALAFAEAVNGVNHLTNLKDLTRSKKTSWYTHPDIHVFIPMHSKATASELNSRIALLAGDPYEVVDFSLRPEVGEADSSKNLQAFYSIAYYHEEIRPKTVYKPNEGIRTIIVITGIETMRKESANAFLKLLEEPAGDLLFILTATKTDQLLPTIVSRCQNLQLQPLGNSEIAESLMKYDGMTREDAMLMSRLAGGNYSQARYFDPEALQLQREELIQFLRNCYTQNPVYISEMIQKWSRQLSRENQIALCNNLELFLRDVMIYKASAEPALLINMDQHKLIEKFITGIPDANIPAMIEHLQHLKELLYQNVQMKYIFTVLSFRYYYLMRGAKPPIPENKIWQHMPALAEI
ncbi:MAG: AAA family ATPase [Balneolaceae bacterium]|nr:MAG: AAA family ATPase [Balneolaceae bacterium]